MLITDALLGNQVSIYCIINEEDKKVQFGYSLTLASHIGFLRNNITKDIQEDRNKIQFKLIETYQQKNEYYLRARVDELYKEYSELGYTFYTSYKPLEWKLYVRVEVGSLTDGKPVIQPFIKLKSSANRTYRIKAMKSIQEADEYVQSTSIVDALRDL